MSNWKGKKVLVTGHTGFKGAWLSMWLQSAGAEVHGFALPEDPTPAAYTALGIKSLLASEQLGDVGEPGVFQRYLNQVKPEAVFHLAAQALVRRSYADPIETLRSNFMGTAFVLEALRQYDHACVGVVVTSDKCYENSGQRSNAFVEGDPLGGHDPYSMSKAACELLVASYRRSFFESAASKILLASARAGNVIGGGDYSADRIIPDCVRALVSDQKVVLRNPDAVRPWQHVLEPVSAYVALGEKLLSKEGRKYCEAWNFGPKSTEAHGVREVVKAFLEAWGGGAWVERADPSAPHEAAALSLDISKAKSRLNWEPRWDWQRALSETASWYKTFEASPKAAGAMRAFSLNQLRSFRA